jgi:large subunit ribosomal protein L2
MGLKTYKPVNSSQRQLINIERSGLWKGGPLKSLTSKKTSKAGRNSHGHITVRHRGGGHKQKYRELDTYAGSSFVAEVERIEYDPNRTAFISLLKHEDGRHSYTVAAHGLHPGSKVEHGDKTDVRVGNRMRIKNIPVGSEIHKVELKVGKGPQIARAAGTSVRLVGRDGQNAIVRLPSGEQRFVPSECFASIGEVSNLDHKNRRFGKAGRNRWRGWRPHVRGSAMNPVDHPHGGGEGKTTGGRHPVSPTGVPAKGKKTRRNKRTGKSIISRRK